MAAVAVREGMDRDQAVVKPEGDFVRVVCGELNPYSCILNEYADRRRYAAGFDPHVRLSDPVSTGPLPHLGKHRLVQIPEVHVVEECQQCRRSAQQCLCDVALLGVEQLHPESRYTSG